MANEPAVHAGGCVCGAVRFEATGDPDDVTVCHCRTCQRMSGAPYMVALGFDTANVRFLGTPPSTYRSGPETWRSFCGTCGGQIGFHRDPPSTRVTLWLTTLDEPDGFQPERHIWTDSARPWALHDDGPPRFPENISL